MDLTGRTTLANLDDIRVYDHFKGSELDRNILGAIGGDVNILFRANHDTIENSEDQNYYIYFNNPVATNPPNDLNNIYVFNDEFNDGVFNTDVWTLTAGSVSEAGGILTLTGGVDSFIAQDKHTLPLNIFYETRTNMDSGSSTHYISQINDGDPIGSTDGIQYVIVSGGANYRNKTFHNGVDTDTAQDAVITGAYEIKGFNWSSGKVDFIRTEARTIQSTSTTNIPDNTDFMQSAFYNGANTMLIDWVRAIEYLPNEIEDAIGTDENVTDLLRFNFVDEISLIGFKPTTVTIDGNNFDANVTITGDMDLNVLTWIVKDYTIIASHGDYLTRSWSFHIDPDTNTTNNLTMLKSTEGTNINFKIYNPGSTAVLGNRDINLMINNTNFASMGTTDSDGLISFPMQIDADYTLAIQDGVNRYDYNRTRVLVHIPRDEKALFNLDANATTLTLTGIGTRTVSNNNLDLNLFVYNNTVNFYKLEADYNTEYFDRALSFKYTGDADTNELQHYLVKTSDGVSTTLSIVDSRDVTTPVPDITVKTLKDINGFVEVESIITDDKGTALQSYIVGDSYTLQFYNSAGTLLFSKNVQGTSTAIYAYMETGELNLDLIPFGSVSIKFNHNFGGVLDTDALTQTIYFTDIDITNIRIFVVNNDINVYHQDFNIGVTNGYINSIIAGTLPGDNNLSYIIHVEVTTPAGMFFGKSSYNIIGPLNPLNLLRTGVKTDIGCKAGTEETCGFLALLSLFVVMIALVALKIAPVSGELLGPSGLPILGLILLGIFVYIEWFPFWLYTIMAFIALAITIGQWRG